MMRRPNTPCTNASNLLPSVIPLPDIERGGQSVCVRVVSASLLKHLLTFKNDNRIASLILYYSR